MVFTCAHCEGWNVAPEVYRGREVVCRHCDEPVRVPTEAAVMTGARERPSGTGVGEVVKAGLGLVVGLVVLLAILPRQCGERDVSPAEVAERDEESKRMGLRVAVESWMRRNLADQEAEIVEMRGDVQDDASTQDVVVVIRGRNALGGRVMEVYRMEVNWRIPEVFSAERVK